MTPVPTVALFMWGDLFEDFYDTLGVTIEDFRTLTGSWMFGYVDALATAGVRTTLVFCSARVGRPLRFVHEPTGAPVVILPAPRRHRYVRRLRRLLPYRRVLKSLASYASLPFVPLLRELRRAGIDVILSQEYEHARFDVLVLLGRLARLPVFATFQGGTAPNSRLERPLRAMFVRACAGVVIGSAGERERVRRDYRLAAERIASVPNAIDVAAYEPLDKAAARRRLGIDPGATVVEWHGVVEIDRKGLDVLVDAWRVVRRTRPGSNLLLLLVGSGRDAERFRALIDGIDGIRWRDEFVADRDELLLYPSAADIYVLPSRREGFAVAPIEAMASGLPVVAADVPGIVETLVEGEHPAGLVVPRADPEALANALGALIDDAPMRATLAANARGRSARYSLEVVGAGLRDFMFHAGAQE